MFLDCRHWVAKNWNQWFLSFWVLTVIPYPFPTQSLASLICLPPTISIRLSILRGGISALNIPVEQKGTLILNSSGTRYLPSTIQLSWRVHGKYHSVIMAGPWKVPFSYHGGSMELALPKLKPRREVAELVMVRSVQGVVGAVPRSYPLFQSRKSTKCQIST